MRICHFLMEMSLAAMLILLIILMFSDYMTVLINSHILAGGQNSLPL